MAPFIPDDILYVISHHITCKTTLRNLVLCSCRFQHTFNRELYRSVELHNMWTSYRLLKTIDRNPALRRYMRNLKARFTYWHYRPYYQKVGYPSASGTDMVSITVGIFEQLAWKLDANCGMDDVLLATLFMGLSYLRTIIIALPSQKHQCETICRMVERAAGRMEPFDKLTPPPISSVILSPADKNASVH